jgi:hypothetical protein
MCNKHVLQFVVITGAINNISNATSSNLISRQRQHRQMTWIECRAWWLISFSVPVNYSPVFLDLNF